MRWLVPAILALAWLGGCAAPEGGGSEELGAAGKCACAGKGCRCINALCGGTRSCGCSATGVDCRCPAKICKSAGTYACCSGTHAHGDKQRCNTTCACTTVPGACACSVSCACGWKKK